MKNNKGGCYTGKKQYSMADKKRLGGKFKNKNFAKIVLLGNDYVGKTSITQRYVNEKFDEIYNVTLGGVYFEKNLEINGKQYSLKIWDTAGEYFRSIMPFYYREATAVLLIYDVTDEKSFQELSYWIEELKNKVITEGMILILVGNKCDVDSSERIVTTQMASNFALQNNISFFECSAKSGLGINEIFQKVIDVIIQQK